MEAVVLEPVKPPTAVSSPSRTTSEKFDLVKTLENHFEQAESHLGVFILGRLLQRLVVGLYTCSTVFLGDQQVVVVDHLPSAKPPGAVPPSDNIESSVQSSSGDARSRCAHASHLQRFLPSIGCERTTFFQRPVLGLNLSTERSWLAPSKPPTT